MHAVKGGGKGVIVVGRVRVDIITHFRGTVSFIAWQRALVNEMGEGKHAPFNFVTSCLYVQCTAVLLTPNGSSQGHVVGSEQFCTGSKCARGGPGA